MLSISYVPQPGGLPEQCVSHSVPVIQMFQPPALIVMTIAATRMYRSLIEFSDLGYSTFCLLHSVLMLTVTDVSLFSIPFGLKGGSR